MVFQKEKKYIIFSIFNFKKRTMVNWSFWNQLVYSKSSNDMPYSSNQALLMEMSIVQTHTYSFGLY